MADYYEAKRKGARVFALTRPSYLPSACSASAAGRGALLALHPLLEGGFRVADRAAQLDVGRPIAGKPPLGQPGHAEVQVPRRLFRRQQRIVLQGFGCRGHSVLWFDLDGQMMKEVLPQNSGLFPQKIEPD
jgi:hypothetical protein